MQLIRLKIMYQIVQFAGVDYFFKNFLMYSESDISVNGCKCCDVCEKSCTCAWCSQ